MRKRKARHQKPSHEQEARPEQPARHESEFCQYRWTGQAATDEFFKLHYEQAFGGTGDSGVVLPPHSLSVSRQPTVGDALVNAYAHGLEYAEQVFTGGGGGLSLVIFGGIPFAYVTVSMWTDIIGGLLSLLLVAFLTAFSLAGLFLLFRFDTTGYRYTPVMFNRALGKVHVFRPETDLFSFRPLWGGGKYRIDTYDWSCVRAQVTRFRVFTGSVAQDNARLGCIVAQAPGSTNVVAEFPIGVSTTALAIQVLLDHWEHIRRFMEHEGPLLQEGEGPYEEWGTHSLLGAFFFGQPLLDLGNSPRSAAKADPLTSIWQVAAVFLFPLLASFGLLRWLSYHLRGQPQWPAEILASVGGAALHGGDLEAWRGMIPDWPKRIETPAQPALETNLKESGT
jgi:hypothetical protein